MGAGAVPGVALALPGGVVIAREAFPDGLKRDVFQLPYAQPDDRSEGPSGRRP